MLGLADYPAVRRDQSTIERSCDLLARNGWLAVWCRRPVSTDCSLAAATKRRRGRSEQTPRQQARGPRYAVQRFGMGVTRIASIGVLFLIDT